MNIFEYDGEEFDKKLDDIFESITKEQLKKELIECGLEIKQETYSIEKENILKEYEDSYHIIESQKIEIENQSIVNKINLIEKGKEEREWMEDLVLAA